MSSLVPIDRRDGVAVLTMDREASLNAMTVESARAVVAALAEADADTACAASC